MAPGRPRNVALGALVCAMILGGVGCDRGVWWYRHGSSDPYGIQTVLIDETGALTALEMADAFETCWIDHVYGSYSILTDVSGGTTANSDKVADWNAELDSRLLTSQYLISEDWTIMADWSSLLARIENRVLTFNDVYGADPAKKFDALHLDIEPQTAPVCKLEDSAYDPVECHALFDAMVPMLEDVVSLKHFYRATVKIYVDLPVWVSDFGPGAKLAWPAPAETSRDLWFQDVAALVDGITLMAYGEDDTTDLWDSVEWEVSTFPKPVRIGLDLNPAGVFPDVASMLLMGMWLKLNHGVDFDLHSANEIEAEGGC